MMNKKNQLSFNNEAKLKEVLNNTYVKVGLCIGAGLVLIYLAGHVFKIFAHTANGYREMTNAFNGKIP